MMMQGYNLEDVARGIDEMMIRQPMGVVGRHHRFQFPRHDSLLVSSLCGRHRKHVRAKAKRTGTANHAARV